MFGERRVDPGLCRGVGRSAQREGDRTKAQLEQPVAARGLQVIVPLGRRPGDQLDLAVVEAEARIDVMALRLYRAVVGQEDALRAALDACWRDRGAGDAGTPFRREQPRPILLSKHLE